MSAESQEVMQTGHRPTFVSLFAGVGGFDLGLERAGFTGVGQVEINPYCQQVLAKHWPEVPRHDDVKTAVDWWLQQERPEVDLVCGGFPCQDISLAKAERKGLDGDRSGLYWEALGFVVAVQPRLVLLENVGGLLSSNDGRDLALIQATMAECGYPYFEWRVLDSQYFGVPQRRVRVFLVASASDPRLGPLLLEPEGRGRDLEALSAARQKSARSAARVHGAGSGARDAGGPAPDPDGVRALARVSRRVDHLGETARTLLTSGQRGDQDSDNFVALLPAEPAGPDAAAPGDREPALLAGDRAGERCAARSDVDGLTLYDDIVTSAITRNSFGHAGATDKTAQANHLVITDVASREIDSGVQPEGGCGCCPIDLAPDANRYGTCGNAVSVPVITWIGHRFWDELIAQRVAETEEWDGS